jgi:hypothetical protein
MYAVLTRLTAEPGKLDEVKALAAHFIMPAYVENAATGAYILASCDRPEVLVIVLYATQAEVECIESGEALRSLRDDNRLLLTSAPTIEVFEVLVGTTGSAPGPALNENVLAFLSDISRAL